jgi:uncharacterized protein (TIGR00369 family)
MTGSGRGYCLLKLADNSGEPVKGYAGKSGQPVDEKFENKNYKASIGQLNKLRNIYHSNCWICGKTGLGLEFALGQNGKVTAEIDCQNIHQGYDGILHGGIIASLLDCAMVNCLFAHGIAAFTAEIKVRYRHPVAVNQTAILKAEITGRSKILYHMTAMLIQNNVTMAKASGKFIKKKE